AALVTIVLIRPGHPPAPEIAKNESSRLDTERPPLRAEPIGNAPVEREQRPRPRRNTGAPQPAKDSAAALAEPEKIKVAVLNFVSNRDEAKEADIGKAASDLLGKKLDSSGYAVIDRKQVDHALQEKKLENRPLDAATAASVGRSLGADAVIVGSVEPAQV